MNNEKYYLRLGEIPVNERSGIYRPDQFLGYENGTSVFNCTIIDDEYFVVLPIKRTGIASDYSHLLDEKERDAYIVVGDEVGTGFDGEPLLRNIKIIKKISTTNKE